MKNSEGYEVRINDQWDLRMLGADPIYAKKSELNKSDIDRIIALDSIDDDNGL
jgi:hypothetical protein